MRYNRATTKRLRRILRNHLQTTQRNFADKVDLKDWFWRKLEGCAAYGVADKSALDPGAMDTIRLRFIHGESRSRIARRYNVTEDTIERWENQVLDHIINQMSREMADGVLYSSRESWRQGVCQREECKYDGWQYWDDDPKDGCFKCGNCNAPQREEEPLPLIRRERGKNE